MEANFRLAATGVKSHTLRAFAAAALGLGCLSAWALPTFTLKPTAAGLSGATVTADNITVSSYARVLTSGSTFSESGFLSVQSFQADSRVVSSAGLNSTYGLYINFTGSGNLLFGGNPTQVPTFGEFTSLSYTLYGYNGPSAKFSFDGSNTPKTDASGAVALASGALIDGTVSTSPAKVNGQPISFVPSAAANVTFVPSPAQSGFFAAPTSFYDLGIAAFTNTVSTVRVISSNEFLISQGGGAFNFAATPVPEPETYAMMLAGLGAIGFVAMRRKQS